MEPLLPGTRVVIKIGHLIFMTKRYMIEVNNMFNGTNNPVPEVGADDIQWYDIRPELIDKEAIISQHTITQGVIQYSLYVDGNYISWFTEKQFEVI